MLNIQLISVIIGIFAGIGLMIGGCGYAYSTWRSGKNKYKDELITDLKSTLQIKEDEITRLNGEKTTLILSHQKQLTDMQKELSELQGAFSELSKKSDDYKAILENRDPMTLSILTQIKDELATLNKGNVISAKALITAADKLENNK